MTAKEKRREPSLSPIGNRTEREGHRFANEKRQRNKIRWRLIIDHEIAGERSAGLFAGLQLDLLGG